MDRLMQWVIKSNERQDCKLWFR